MNALNTADYDLEALNALCSRLGFDERKALITLARSQTLPDPIQSPILFSKVRVLLDKLSMYPPYQNADTPLLPEGHLIIRLLRSPLTRVLRPSNGVFVYRT
jgi:type II secretory pathway component PulK